MLTNIALFQSDEFDRSFPADEDEVLDEREPWGRDLAVFLIRSLKGKGMHVKHPTPFSGEGGWSFEVLTAPSAVSLFVHWVPIGNPSQDYWAVQIRQRRPLLQHIFGSSGEATSSSVVQILDEILREHAGVSAFRWLTAEEFAAIY